MKYTIEQLNTYITNPVEDNIVVHIINKEEWDKLKSICPNISDYFNDRYYYLTAFSGCSMTSYYKSIEMRQIEFETKEIIGYLAPIDLFEGKVKKDCIYKYLNSYNCYLPDYGDKLNTQTSPASVKLPSEIVESWKPAYKSTEIKINGYVAEKVTDNSLKFGCQLITKNTLLVLQELFNKTDFSFTCKINQEEIKVKTIDLLLKLLKS